MKRFLVLGCVACTSGPKVYGPVYDGAAGDAQADGSATDAPSDVASDVVSDAPSCPSTLAVLGGSGSALFGAFGSAGSTLTATAMTGSLHDCGNNFGCSNPVTIARFGSGLLAVLASGTGALESTRFTTSWQAPAAIGTASTIDGPALAVIGTTAHLLFQGTDYKYYHGQYTTSWDAANDPVGGMTTQSYGARGPAAASTGTTLVALQAGSDSYLYDQTWTGSWQAATKHGASAIQNTLPPSITALGGGASELLAVYLENGDYKVMALARTGGTWASAPTQINVNAYSNDPVTVAPLPGGKALVVFRGSDQHPYWTMWDGTSTFSAPVAVLSSNPLIASAPSVAPGVCGADAFVAWAESGGGVTVVPFTAGTFGYARAVLGTTGAKFVAIGTLP